MEDYISTMARIGFEGLCNRAHSFDSYIPRDFSLPAIHSLEILFYLVDDGTTFSTPNIRETDSHLDKEESNHRRGEAPNIHPLPGCTRPNCVYGNTLKHQKLLDSQK